MLKREKQVFGYLLKTENDVMRTLERQYQKALKDIEACIKVLQADELTQSKVYRIQYQKNLKKQVEAILEKLHSDEYTSMQQYLSGTYTDAYVGTVYSLHGQGVPVLMPIDQTAAVKAVMTNSKISTDLYTHLGVDISSLKKTIRNQITRGIASGMLYQDIARNVARQGNITKNRALNIVQTEGHRIQQESADDARRHAISKGADLVKQWDSTLDANTRDSHRRLDGQVREEDEPFEIDGKTAMRPGGFGDPSEDCRCRCVALSRVRSAMNEAELATMQERAKFFGLDKTKDFEEFRQKYVEKSVFMPVDETVKITKKKGERIYSSVDADLVNSKKYHDKFEGLTAHKPVNESIYQEAMRMLEHRDGTPHEDMVLIDSRTGKFITGNMDSSLVGKTGLTATQYAAVENHKGKMTIVHNHPNSSRISYTDILTMYRNPNIDSIVAVGHDGSVQIVSALNRKVDIEKAWEKVYNDAVEVYKDKTLAEHEATNAIYALGVFNTESR